MGDADAKIGAVSSAMRQEFEQQLGQLNSELSTATAQAKAVARDNDSLQAQVAELREQLLHSQATGDEFSHRTALLEEGARERAA